VSESQPSPLTLQQPSSLAEAKARFAASWDLATLQVAEIEQVALPSPPGFVVWRIVGTRGCILMPALLPTHHSESGALTRPGSSPT